MEQVYKTNSGGLWVGDDNDANKALENNWFVISACKDGPHGHRSMLGYTTKAAPKDDNYNFFRRGKHLVLNLIDSDNPAFINDTAIEEALSFINKHIEDGKILIHCNQGISRSPSIAILFLRSIGDLPPRFQEGYKIFKVIYDKYNPGIGMRQYLKGKYKEITTNA